jgi:single-strand DNA-binding protein
MLNKLQIIGRVGKDPEIRYLPSGEAVVNFSVATTEKWKDKSGEQREETEWHKVSAFGRLAEIVGEYVKKGGLIYVEGKIKTRKYTDKDGVEKYSTEVKATEMKLLGGKSEGAQQKPAQREEPQRQPARQQSAYDEGFDDMDGDIPF